MEEGRGEERVDSEAYGRGRREMVKRGGKGGEKGNVEEDEGAI